MAIAPGAALRSRAPPVETSRLRRRQQSPIVEIGIRDAQVAPGRLPDDSAGRERRDRLWRPPEGAVGVA